MAIEPPPCRYVFPDPRTLAAGEQIVGVGADFLPGTLLGAYRLGIFPWPHRGVVPWFSPDPRAVFPLARPFPFSRSLRRALRKHPYRVSADEAFVSVARACGETRPEGTWVSEPLIEGYAGLHALGWAHSIEVWEGEELVGGIYGVQVGGAFVGESMFHRRRDASKIAFASLAERLEEHGFKLFDVQVQNDHLASLGCEEIPREAYLDKLERASALPCVF